jgi:hypothetical protein
VEKKMRVRATREPSAPKHVKFVTALLQG